MPADIGRQKLIAAEQVAISDVLPTDQQFVRRSAAGLCSSRLASAARLCTRTTVPSIAGMSMPCAPSRHNPRAAEEIAVSSASARLTVTAQLPEGAALCFNQRSQLPRGENATSFGASYLTLPPLSRRDWGLAFDCYGRKIAPFADRPDGPPSSATFKSKKNQA